MKATPILHLRRYAAPQGCFHIARHRIPPGQARHVHRHDFPELFWVEHGTGRHRIAAADHSLSPGDLWFIRAEDEHDLGGALGGLTIINLALAPAIADDLVGRYGAVADLWTGGPEERRRRLGPAALRRIGALIDGLTQAYGGSRERLALDRFLIELIEVLATADDGSTGPEWLRSAVATLAADPRLLGEGPMALQALSGRSREHVARTVRRHLGRSPRELLLGLRLERSAQALRMGDDAILAVALDAGFANLSYFYRRFRARFGCTPKAYRRLHQGPVTP